VNPERVETLRDVLIAIGDAAGAKGGSWFERQSSALGMKVRYTTFDRILNGTYHSQPSKRLLETIVAVGMKHGLPDVEARVYAAAARPMPTGEFAAQLPEGVDTLSPASRKALLAVITNMIELQRATESHAAVVPISKASRAQPARRNAARRGTPGEGGSGAGV
jgi:hypothetical protein